jgi:hypothetical protein
MDLRPLRGPKSEPEPGYSWCSGCQQFHPEEGFGKDPRGGLKRYCYACANAAQKAWAAKNRDAVNLRVRLKKYGITQKHYDEMLQRCGRRCQICGRERLLDIDHCHAQGHVRGLLCGPCNRGIGFLDDDVSLLESAIAYLKRTTPSDQQAG